MSLLSDKRILEEVERGNIIIEPIDDRQLSANSYDCRLGPYYYEPQISYEPIRFTDQKDSERFWGEPICAKDGEIPIKRGETILAHTIEIIGARNGFTTIMKARSSMGRSGLSVVKAMGVGDPNYISRWTIDITNHTMCTVIIPVGLRVCQMLFHEIGPTLKEYTGKYGDWNNWSPQDMIPKMYRDWDLGRIESGEFSGKLDLSEA